MVTNLAAVEPVPVYIVKRKRHRSWLPSINSERSWLSKDSNVSILSLGAELCIASAGSLASVGSAGSLLSIGSAGSILSVGSAGSILSYKSAGSILSIRSTACILGTDQVGVIGVGFGEDGATDHTDRPSLVTNLATVFALAGLLAAALGR